MPLATGYGFPDLYQATTTLFVGLLIAVVVNELRGTGDAGGRSVQTERGRAVVVVLFAVALVAGEAASTIALAIGRGSRALFIATLFCAAATVIPAVIQAVWVAASHFPSEVRKKVVRISAAALTLVLVGALVVGQLSQSSEATRPSTLNLPKQFRVYGTCVSGSCGLNKRARPDTRSMRVGVLHDGDRVAVRCQTQGTRVTAEPGHTSLLWDQLDDGSFVSDLFVSTPESGDYSEGIALCPAKPVRDRPIG
jgi:hypothetical protein